MKMNLTEKLNRTKGLCTSVANFDDENAAIITVIINEYMTGKIMQYANRCEENWQICMDLPMNFSEYRFRIRS